MYEIYDETNQEEIFQCLVLCLCFYYKYVHPGCPKIGGIFSLNKTIKWKVLNRIFSLRAFVEKICFQRM